MTSSMLELLLIGFLTYYISLLVFVYKMDWREMLGLKVTESAGPETEVNKEVFPETLLGKSTFVFKTPEPDIKPEPVQEPEEDEYYDGEEEEPEEESNVEKEDIEELERSSVHPDADYATGASFDDLELTVKVVHNKDSFNEKEKAKAAETLEQIQNTSIIESIMAQIPNAETTVEKLLRERLDRYYREKVSDKANTTTDIPIPEELQSFNMNYYV